MLIIELLEMVEVLKIELPDALPGLVTETVVLGELGTRLLEMIKVLREMTVVVGGELTVELTEVFGGLLAEIVEVMEEPVLELLGLIMEPILVLVVEERGLVVPLELRAELVDVV